MCTLNHFQCFFFLWQIYNEMIRDLLNPSSGFLELREDSRGVVVSGISEVQANKTSEVRHCVFCIEFTSSLTKIMLSLFIVKFRTISLVMYLTSDWGWGRGGRGTPYNELYRENLPERGTLFRLELYKRTGNSQAEIIGKIVGKLPFVWDIGVSFSVEGIWMGYLFCHQWFLKGKGQPRTQDSSRGKGLGTRLGKGLDLGVALPCIKLSWVLLPPPPGEVLR